MTDRDCPCCGTTMRRNGRRDDCPSCGASLPAGWQIRVPHARRIVERAEKLREEQA